MSQGKIVLFGAGATGRGHVGLLTWQAGFELVLVEKDPALADALRQAGRYHVRLYGEGAAGREIEVTGFRVYISSDREAVAREIVDAALVLTAVFDPNLPDVAQTLACAVRACRAAGRAAPLNCIACENMMDSSSKLGAATLALLEGEDLAYARERLGFPDCMISRVVPRPEPDPLLIIAEDYNEWTARAETYKGEKPAALTALELVSDQTAHLERKLFVHNGGHAICGYFGWHRGHTYVHEAVADPVVAEHVVRGMDELGEVVRRKHGFSAESIEVYKMSLCMRGAIAEMKDAIVRVVRDPARKLTSHERLVAPALLAVEYGLPRGWIVQGIVAALRYRRAEDPQSIALSEKIECQGLKATLQEVCQIAPDHPLAAEIEAAWNAWEEQGVEPCAPSMK